MFKVKDLAAGICVAATLVSSTVYAAETVVWWDFLGGGDGVRMKQMIADFNAEHEGKSAIDATTPEWGVPE